MISYVKWKESIPFSYEQAIYMHEFVFVQLLQALGPKLLTVMVVGR